MQMVSKMKRAQNSGLKTPNKRSRYHFENMMPDSKKNVLNFIKCSIYLFHLLLISIKHFHQKVPLQMQVSRQIAP